MFVLLIPIIGLSILPLCARVIGTYYETTGHTEQSIWWIGRFLATFAMFTPTIYVMRAWLLYYDMRLSQTLKNQHWQMAIDPNLLSKNWYLNPKNQRRFGNNGYQLLFYGFCLSLCEMSLFYLLWFSGQFIAAVTSAGFLLMSKVLYLLIEFFFWFRAICLK